MKKLLTLLLIFSLAFSVSAVPVKNKVPEKSKIEKTIFQPDFIFVVSFNCEQNKVITMVSDKNEFCFERIYNCNYKQNDERKYIAEISRKLKKDFLIPS